MNEVQKAQLIDEYDEATLRLFMEKYKDAEDLFLWNEYQIALCAYDLPKIPTTLDVRCKELIREYLSHSYNLK